MIHGFDEKLTCEGIIGDGCGGGRVFTIDENKLKAYDPQSKETVVLMDNVIGAKAINKKACTIFIECENEHIEFDLPTMTSTIKKF